MTLDFVDPAPQKVGAESDLVRQNKCEHALAASARPSRGPSAAVRGLAPHLDTLPDSHPVRLPVAAELLGGVHRTTVWRWVREGRLPKPISIGGVPTFMLGLIRAVQRNGLESKKTADPSLRLGG